MAKAKPASRNVALFRAHHDPDVVVPNKIREALANMEKDHGPEHYEYESDFIKLAGVNTTQMAAHRDAFTAFIVEAKPIGMGNARTARRAWFATAKAAKSARGE